MTDIRGGITLVQESAVGVVDGVNDTFATSAKFIGGTLRVEQNGVKLLAGEDFTEAGDQAFVLVVPPEATLGYVDKVTVEYERK